MNSYNSALAHLHVLTLLLFCWKINLLLAENNEILLSAHLHGPKKKEAPRTPNRINKVGGVKKMKGVKTTSTYQLFRSLCSPYRKGPKMHSS